MARLDVMTRSDGNLEASAATPVAATVGEIMSAPVVTVTADAPIAEIAETLRSRRISGVPVVDPSNAVIGLVSEYDLLARQGDTAADVMTTAVVSAAPDIPLDDVRHLLIDRRIRRIPVIDGGRLVGIVSRGDIVALMATEWVCDVCGEPVRGASPPAQCPTCRSGPERFTLQEQPPGH